MRCAINFPRKSNASFLLSILPIAVLCNQHHSKTRFPRHHFRVGCSCLLEWNGLDHCRHTTQRAETKRCVTSGRGSRQRACYLALSEYEIHAGDLDRIGSDANVDGDTSGTQSLEGRGDSSAARGGYQNDFCAAEFLKCRSGIVSGTVDVMVSPEFLRQLRRFTAATDRSDFETHASRILDAKMTEAADTENSDKFTRFCLRVSQSVESGETRTQQWCGID